MDRPVARRSRPFAFAGALVRASARASADLAAEGLRTTARVVERTVEPVGSALVATGSQVVRTVAGVDVGVGEARLSPEGLEWLRAQVARGLRELLTADVEGAELLRATDPTAMARAVLALLGGEERLAPMPAPDEQIRRRFRSLLDPTAADTEGMTPALLAVTAQLSPDEARILRYLDSEGQVPVLTVMAGSLTSRTGPVVADNLTVVVARAGGDHPERGPDYVTNLERLGLCTIDDERLGGHPDVDLITTEAAFQAAIREVRDDGGRPRVRARTLRLTALGQQLVAIALHGEGSGAETVRELPGPPPPPRRALDQSDE